jgi:hypothetical protein
MRAVVAIVAAIEHKRAAGMNSADSVGDHLRDCAFTTLNRFVALKMLEARELVQECITKGEQSADYREFCGMAPGMPLLPDGAGYRLYIESLFDELSTEVSFPSPIWLSLAHLLKTALRRPTRRSTASEAHQRCESDQVQRCHIVSLVVKESLDSGPDSSSVLKETGPVCCRTGARFGWTEKETGSTVVDDHGCAARLSAKSTNEAKGVRIEI